MPQKIVITGGPCSGKTKILEGLRRHGPMDSIFLVEAATILYGGGFPRFDDQISRMFQQETIYTVQKNMEKIISHKYQDRNIFCDRGTLDGLAYWPDTEAHFFEYLRTTFQEELSSYSACIFLQIPSETDYINYSLRTESYDKALALEARLYNIWSKHQNFFYVERKNTFQNKMLSVEKVVKSVLDSSAMPQNDKQ